MTFDRNVCECGWSEHRSHDSFSPYRRKCPECGAPLVGHWKERTFGTTSSNQREERENE